MFDVQCSMFDVVFLLFRDVVLEGTDGPVLFLQGLDGGDGGSCAGQGGDHRHLVQHGHRADLALVGGGAFFRRGVDDQVDLGVLDVVDDVGAALGELGDAGGGDVIFREDAERAVGGDQLEAAIDQR